MGTQVRRLAWLQVRVVAFALVQRGFRAGFGGFRFVFYACVNHLLQMGEGVYGLS